MERQEEPACSCGHDYSIIRLPLAQGNIFELLVSSWEKLRPFLAYKTEFGKGARFEQKYIFPEDACREALINAIAHRDYSIQNGTDIFIFHNRMQIKSPGALLSTISAEDIISLAGAHESRNSLIARVLRENNFMRELGEGIKRIFTLMEENDLEKPMIESSPTSFTITLPHKSVFTTRQKEWLELFAEFNLTSLQKRIVVLGMDDKEIAPEDIYRAMSTRDRDTYDKEVTGLRESNILHQIRTNVAANRIAKQTKTPKGKIGRFKIVPPSLLQEEENRKGVFVANLSPSTRRDDLFSLFSQYGKIEKIQLSLPHKGFGFVWFDNPATAQKAIRELDRYILNGSSIKTDKIRPKR